jgi:hypothetical protein
MGFSVVVAISLVLGGRVVGLVMEVGGVSSFSPADYVIVIQAVEFSPLILLGRCRLGEIWLWLL